MRTTIDIPEALLKDAMGAVHARTKTGAIVLGLKELVRRRRIEGLRSLRGKIALAVDLKASRSR